MNAALDSILRLHKARGQEILKRTLALDHWLESSGRNNWAKAVVERLNETDFCVLIAGSLASGVPEFIDKLADELMLPLPLTSEQWLNMSEPLLFEFIDADSAVKPSVKTLEHTHLQVHQVKAADLVGLSVYVAPPLDAMQTQTPLVTELLEHAHSVFVPFVEHAGVGKAEHALYEQIQALPKKCPCWFIARQPISPVFTGQKSLFKGTGLYDFSGPAPKHSFESFAKDLTQVLPNQRSQSLLSLSQELAALKRAELDQLERQLSREHTQKHILEATQSDLLAQNKGYHSNLKSASKDFEAVEAVFKQNTKQIDMLVPDVLGLLSAEAYAPLLKRSYGMLEQSGSEHKRLEGAVNILLSGLRLTLKRCTDDVTRLSNTMRGFYQQLGLEPQGTNLDLNELKLLTDSLSVPSMQAGLSVEEVYQAQVVEPVSERIDAAHHKVRSWHHTHMSALAPVKNQARDRHMEHKRQSNQFDKRLDDRKQEIQSANSRIKQLEELKASLEQL